MQELTAYFNPSWGQDKCSCFLPSFPVFTEIKDTSVLCCLFVLNTDLVFMKHL